MKRNKTPAQREPSNAQLQIVRVLYRRSQMLFCNSCPKDWPGAKSNGDSVSRHRSVLRLRRSKIGNHLICRCDITIITWGLCTIHTRLHVPTNKTLKVPDRARQQERPHSGLHTRFAAGPIRHWSGWSLTKHSPSVQHWNLNKSLSVGGPDWMSR